MTNFEYVKTLSEKEFAAWLGMMIASSHNNEDFNRWAIYRDQCKQWAEKYLSKKHEGN